MTDCVFCPIPTTVKILAEWMPQPGDVPYTRIVMFEPLSPVVSGHVIIVPRIHYPDASWRALTEKVMGCVADVVRGHQECNVITSKGKFATQTVFHFHVHIVPRTPDDGLLLPWSPQPTPSELKRKGW